MIKKLQKKGVIRNKYELLIIQKQNLKRKSDRFSKSNLSAIQPQNNQYLNKQLLGTEINKETQMTTMSSLPPEWLDKYEQIVSILKQVSQIKKEVSNLNTKRLNTIREKQEIEIDRAIFNKATQATKKIQLSDKLLKEISSIEKNNESDQKLCQNMCKALAIEIQEKTRQLRTQQRAYVQQKKKFANSTKVDFLDLAVDKALDGDYKDDEFFQQQQFVEDMKLKQRNEEILKMVESINQLSTIYRELGNLVVIQGTLLDRIDFNIDQTVKHVQKGNKHLEKALQHQKSPFACRCIIALIFFIFILAIVIGIKYSRK